MHPHPHYENLDTQDGDRSNDAASTSDDSLSSRLRSFASPDRFRAVVLFSACTVLLFADQNLMAPNLTAIGNEFQFTPQQRDQKLGGDISFAFFLLGAPASIVVGCLADHYNRTKLFAITVGIGEGACMLTFWSKTYTQLYMLRAITGFSLGGAFPLIFSILGDLFPADERHTVSALVGIGTGVGTSLGQGVSGFLGPTFGWRLPFLIPSIPALICAIAVWLTVEDPERGAMEEAARTRRQSNSRDKLFSQQSSSMSNQSIEMTPLGGILPDESANDISDQNIVEDQGIIEVHSTNHVIWNQWHALRSLLSTPTVVLALIQGGPGCIPWGVIGTYLNDFLSEDRGMSVEGATLVLLIFGVGNFFGQLIGGTGGTQLYRLDRRYPALLAGFSAIIGCIPFLVLLNFVDSSSSLVFIVLVSVISGFTCAITGPIIKAQLQNVTPPQSRGLAFAFFNLFDDFGKGLGPVFVAVLISRMGGRVPAFNAAVLGWLVCGLLNLAIFFTAERDEQMVQTMIATSMKQVLAGSDCYADEEQAVRVGTVSEMEEPALDIPIPQEDRSGNLRRRSS